MDDHFIFGSRYALFLVYAKMCYDNFRCNNKLSDSGHIYIHRNFRHNSRKIVWLRDPSRRDVPRPMSEMFHQGDPQSKQRSFAEPSLQEIEARLNRYCEHPSYEARN